MNSRHYFLILLGICLISAPLHAQGGEWLLTNNVGNFFACLVGGILLAMAFQFLITNLGVAAGISAVGNIRKQANSSSSDSSSSDSDSSSSTSIGVKITSGLGIFLTISMSIALFFASFIAVKLSLIPSNLVGFSLGLIIWAGFLIISLWMESRMISSLLGSVVSAARGALTSGANTVSGIFSSGSDQPSTEKTARKTVEAIHDEIRQEYDLGHFEEKLNEYVDKLEPKGVDMDELHHRIADLLHDIEVKEQYRPEDPDATKKMFLEIAGEQSNVSAKDKEKLSNAFDKAKAAMSEGDSKKEKAAKAVDKLTPGSEEQGREYRKKVEEYLRNSDQDTLQPEELEEDLQRIFNNPKAAPQVLKARVSQIDRGTVKAFLSNDGMSEEQAEKYMNKAEQVISKIRSKADDAQQKAEESQDQAQGAADDKKQEAKQKASEKKIDAEMKMRTWFNRMDRPELKYERLKLDAQRMMDDPKAAPQILKKRLQKMDRESLMTLVSNNPKIERSQVEQTVNKIEEARDKVIHKAEELENEARKRLEQAKQEGLKQAEATRKTAASAAWWLFLAAVLSGGASALGGIFALSI